MDENGSYYKNRPKWIQCETESPTELASEREFSYDKDRVAQLTVVVKDDFRRRKKFEEIERGRERET